MKSSEDDERPLRSALRSGPTRTPNRVSFSPVAECGVSAERRQGSAGGPGVALPTEMRGRCCRLMALTADLTNITHSEDGPTLELWNTLTLSKHRPLQDRAAPSGGGGVSHMSEVLGELLELVEQNWTGPGSLQRNAVFLEGAYDLLSELAARRGGAEREEGGARLKHVNSEVIVLRRRLERSEQLLERMKKRLVVTIKENYELKRQMDFRNLHE